MYTLCCNVSGMLKVVAEAEKIQDTTSMFCILLFANRKEKGKIVNLCQRSVTCSSAFTNAVDAGCHKEEQLYNTSQWGWTKHSTVKIGLAINWAHTSYLFNPQGACVQITVVYVVTFITAL